MSTKHKTGILLLAEVICDRILSQQYHFSSCEGKVMLVYGSDKTQCCHYKGGRQNVEMSVEVIEIWAIVS